uniref:NADH-ubiquinone oxidoreductase chain 6 n=1 Tax=Coleoptera sp. ACP-2013 TaxID=2485033 RepID=A0A3G3MED6_9COLE|nr:NADH dehydrogenase subunit 6 [Coleoptera sp. ACP-2013]
MTLNLLMTSLMTSLTIMFITHPLSMGGLILMQTILISITISNLSTTTWFSYILFLVMIGGLMILFIYMTSIASNEKFKLKLNLMLTFPSLIMLTSFMPMKTSLFFSLLLKNSEFFNNNLNLPTTTTLTKFMIWPSSTLLLFIILYLLITMIAIVKITKNPLGPLRPKN